MMIKKFTIRSPHNSEFYQFIVMEPLRDKLVATDRMMDANRAFIAREQEVAVAHKLEKRLRKNADQTCRTIVDALKLPHKKEKYIERTTDAGISMETTSKIIGVSVEQINEILKHKKISHNSLNS